MCVLQRWQFIAPLSFSSPYPFGKPFVSWQHLHDSSRASLSRLFSSNKSVERIAIPPLRSVMSNPHFRRWVSCIRSACPSRSPISRARFRTCGTSGQIGFSTVPDSWCGRRRPQTNRVCTSSLSFPAGRDTQPTNRAYGIPPLI